MQFNIVRPDRAIEPALRDKIEGCREVPRPRHQRETLQAAGLALDGKQSKLALVKSFSHPGSSALHPS